MTDTVIKGSGNSRSIKSVPNLAALAPTYDKLLELLTGEGLPIDLGPLNPAGLNVRGTDLNKAALLKDETAALYGLGADATPNDVFAKPLGQIEIGSYSGTGSAIGSGNPKKLVFPFKPNLVIIIDNTGDYDPCVMVRPSRYARISNKSRTPSVEWAEKEVYFYTSSDVLNTSGKTFYYIAIG